MTSTSDYPFSNLTPEQVRKLVEAARMERARAVRSFVAGLFRRGRKDPVWPARRRETQVWPPKNAPALSLTVHR